MKAEELMIGNIVKIDKGIGLICNIATKEYESWKIDDEYNIRAYVENCYYDCVDDEINPIEITPKLLLSIGFELEPSDFLGYDISEWYSMNTEEFHLSLRGGLSNTPDRFWSAHIDNADFQSIGSCDLQYLHQLQNFMTLVGYPLKIDLERLVIKKE